MTQTPVLKLGLIGLGIGASRAPELHRCCAAQFKLDLTYQLLTPEDASEHAFRRTLDACRAGGIHAVNVTHPFKELALRHARAGTESIARLGAANTLLFSTDCPTLAFNTDYSGFIAAWKARFGERAPGRVGILGAGGVGRAIAFALSALGAAEISIYDVDSARATALVRDLTQKPNAARNARRARSAQDALRDKEGVVNATPLGMVGHGGSPVPSGGIPPGTWAFDSVYTPVATPFLAAAQTAGRQLLSGFELFLHQGIDAFKLFTGLTADASPLRAALALIAPVPNPVTPLPEPTGGSHR